MTGRSTVSVIIPVFDAAKYVEDAVLSAVHQPEVAEVLLVEDGSKDNSLEVSEALGNRFSKVRLLRHPGGVNMGAGPSRNLGIEAATSELIAFLDADDLYCEGRFSESVRILDQEPQVDGVYETIGTFFESEDDRLKWSRRHIGLLFGITSIVDPEDLFRTLIAGDKGHWSTIGLTVRKSLFDRSGYFTDMPTSQDMHMWYRMAAVGSLVCGQRFSPVSMRRVHPGNRHFLDDRARLRVQLERTYQLILWSKRTGVGPEKTLLLTEQYLAYQLSPQARRGRVDLAVGLWRAVRVCPRIVATRSFCKCLFSALFGARCAPWLSRLKGMWYG